MVLKSMTEGIAQAGKAAVMSRQELAEQHTHMRLRAEFLESFQWKHNRLTRDGFREWARNERRPPIHAAIHRWSPMRLGKPVPRAMVEAFSEYISDVLHLGRFPISDIASFCDHEPPSQSDSPSREPNPWILGFSDLFAYLAKNFSVPEDAYCQNEDDIHLAATMVVRWVGEQTDKTASGDATIAIGERAMQRTLDDYAQLLLKLWKANEHAVLFATQRDDHSIGRVGVAAMAPVTEDFYQRFRKGGAEDSDLGPGDLRRISRFILFDAASENRGADMRRAKSGRSMALARTTLYQLAALTPPLDKGNTKPRVITFAGTPESEKRLRAFHYRETGAKTRLTGKAVMEFAPPSLRTSGLEYPRDLAHYLAMKAIGLMYQAGINGQQQQLED